MSKDLISIESPTNNLPLPNQSIDGISLGDRFRNKAMELAREGFFGSLISRNSQLQSCYSSLVRIIDQSHVPILIYGEQGTGKRRLVEEYLVLVNFHRRLEGLSKVTLRVLNSKFLRNGWTDLLSMANNKEGDFIFLENVDELSKEHQEELKAFINTNYHSPDLGCARLIFGTEKALSMLVMQKVFCKDLFKQISQVALFLPSLNERAEDMPFLVQHFCLKLSGIKQDIPAWFVNFATSQLWGRNLDELKMLLKNMLLKQKNIKYWTPSDIPALYSRSPSRTFKPATPNDYTNAQEKRVNLKRALVEAHGDKKKAGSRLGLSKAEVLRKMLELRVR